MKDVFGPCSIGTLTLKNRIIRSATHEGMAQTDGMPTGDLLKIYRAIAAGGAGAIITGYVGVMQNGRTFSNMRMFDRDDYIAVYRSINDELKQYGVPVILQLAHGGGRSLSRVTGRPVMSASRRWKNDSGDRVKAASEADIRLIIDAFVAAIVRAKAAGFDGVQLHAAHGYLLSEFVSPVLNRRKDRWGGSTENRMRIVTEILSEARGDVGSFPILVKISAHNAYTKKPTEADTLAMVRMLKDAACDAVEVSCGYGDFFQTVRMPKVPVDAILGLMPKYQNLPPYRKRLFRLMAPLLAQVRTPVSNYNVGAAELIRQNVDIPVIVVGGIRSMRDITEIIQEKDIDFVSLSRPFIAETDIVKRFQLGQELSRCINCGYCLIGVANNSLRCYYGRVPAGINKRE